MKHLTLGTAGHVDHGKTALIKALTGFDCDTHKAEKERGITINLGFTHITLPSGNTIGIVDVPGHEDFIHTMVEGAMGIDLGILVIAANEGIKPQTIEHINIIKILGIDNVIIAITKTDTVSAEQLSTVKQEIENFLTDTYLANAPVIDVSAVTGQGISQLINEIDIAAAKKNERSAIGPFRMFIDRIFTKPGFGTIVTGSALNGKITDTSSVYILPTNKNASIKKLQRFGQDVSSITAGDRVAINLSGLKTSELKRGMVISDRILKTTTMIDIHLTINPGRTSIRTHSDIMFHAGIYSLKAEINILTGEILHNGESGYAQLKLPRKCILRYGDRFVIRSSSGDKTLGGGYILDITPLHHKKRRATVTEALNSIHEKGLPELITQKVQRENSCITLNNIAVELNYSINEILLKIPQFSPEIISIKADNNVILCNTEVKEQYKNKIIEIILSFFKRNPYATTGLSETDISAGFAIQNIPESAKQILIKTLLQELKSEKQIIPLNSTWTIPGYPAQKKDEKPDIIADFIKKCGKEMKAPTPEQLEQLRIQNKITEKEFRQIIAQLIRNKIIYSSEGVYIHKETVEHIRRILIRFLMENENGITVARFRDLTNGNRKICIPLLILFDNEGTTIRKGNVRILSGKAKRQHTIY